MITYHTGDATAVPAPIALVHVCNDLGAWGRGFTAALSKRFTEPEAAFRTASPLPLGTVQVVPVADGLVFNCVAQHGIGRQERRLQYDVLQRCLRDVATTLKAHNLQDVHMPRIGCGLAGGRWDDVERIIAATLRDFSVHVYDL